MLLSIWKRAYIYIQKDVSLLFIGCGQKAFHGEPSDLQHSYFQICRKVGQKAAML